MSAAESDTLPGGPGGTLEAVWRALEPVQRVALLPHLLGETSADWLEVALRDEGFKVSASTIRSYRRRLAQRGDVQL